MEICARNFKKLLLPQSHWPKWLTLPECFKIPVCSFGRGITPFSLSKCSNRQISIKKLIFFLYYFNLPSNPIETYPVRVFFLLFFLVVVFYCDCEWSFLFLFCCLKLLKFKRLQFSVVYYYFLWKSHFFVVI